MRCADYRRERGAGRKPDDSGDRLHRRGLPDAGAPSGDWDGQGWDRQNRLPDRYVWNLDPPVWGLLHRFYPAASQNQAAPGDGAESGAGDGRTASGRGVRGDRILQHWMKLPAGQNRWGAETGRLTIW